MARTRKIGRQRRDLPARGDYIRYREPDHQHGKTSVGMLRQIIRISKLWWEYAGHLPIEAIDDKVMREFIPWRRDAG